MKSNNNKGAEMTFTAVIEVTSFESEQTAITEVDFSNRQNAIDYLWPFYRKRSAHRKYRVKIVRSDGVVLAAPSFGKSHYNS